MLIGELAEKAGTRPSTLRYYEERGLLPPAVRTASGYRSYDDGAVQRLQFIDRARAAGLTLAQIAKILDVRDAGGSPCAHVRDLLDRQLVDIEKQLARLNLLRATISGLRAHAAQTTSEACAPETICRYL
ncbi:heavy metal-responsive transcriptional regulator [Tessaracoccus sp. MC1627]|jgi:DNA-binding transcriptional MerR regulator|uniref:heavy metal-responsive transcriptional regulator n=1 Tax=Tessaracoccus sp. MC1627 TaxID=2760312 RepID=UPI0016040637|nr:heavy metal-responsive transcriptional regulator [Tessaracoccus sp. MC1627]MBB1512095.1 heavy metal-responsive transcriptional regulator [Tessaracoccus sp. MC1627]